MRANVQRDVPGKDETTSVMWLVRSDRNDSIVLKTIAETQAHPGYLHSTCTDESIGLGDPLIKDVDHVRAMYCRIELSWRFLQNIKRRIFLSFEKKKRRTDSSVSSCCSKSHTVFSSKLQWHLKMSLIDGTGKPFPQWPFTGWTQRRQRTIWCDDKRQCLSMFCIMMGYSAICTPH